MTAKITLTPTDELCDCSKCKPLSHRADLELRKAVLWAEMGDLYLRLAQIEAELNRIP